MTPGTTPSARAGGVAPFRTVVFRARCPHCGRGPLFAGLLDIAPVCTGCGLHLSDHDAGDGPAVAAIFLLGALTVIGAFLVEFRLEPPFWVHLLLWPVVLVPGAILVMRLAKAALIWAQWRHRRDAGGD